MTTRLPLLPYCDVLKNKQEYQEAIQVMSSFGLPVHGDAPKNWDSLAALSALVRHTDPDANILVGVRGEGCFVAKGGSDFYLHLFHP